MFEMNQSDACSSMSMALGLDAEPGVIGGMAIASRKGGSKGKGHKSARDIVFLPDPLVALDFEQKPAKTRLNEFLPKKLGRSITKADTTYSSVEQEPGQHQAMLTLHCLDNQQFAGEICSSQKEAEQSVAQQCLDHYADEVALHAGVSKKRQMGLSKNHKPTPNGQGIPLADAIATGYPQLSLPAPDFLGGLTPAAPVPKKQKQVRAAQEPAPVRRDGPNYKDQFLAFLSHKIGRSVTRAEFTFNNILVAQGQHQATVTLHCLGEQQFAGEVCPSGKAAQMSAAQQALAYYAEEVAQYEAQKALKPSSSGSKKKSSAAGGGGGDVSIQLGHLLSTMLGRPPTHTDFSYHHMELEPGQHQSALTLHCFQEQQFAGEVCGSLQAAQASAAQQVLMFYANEMGMPVGMGGEGPPSKKQKKRKKDNDSAEKAAMLANPDSSGGLWQAKEQLSQICKIQCGHSGNWRKGQIEYAVHEVPPGYQAVVKLNCLGGAEYAGEVSSTAKEAERSAALYAYAALSAGQAAVPASPMQAAMPDLSMGLVM
eukprot:TRINITY_DN18216_c0_g1_i2.p1 TRINITY_DN18216_c0_g1~~TRINITY_DN18216_c0_g1_i2.p1  ORF type:complete len:539 (-),score=110.47 TRINITY_DN18216_c0_g1_i2:19-1635(-)